MNVRDYILPITYGSVTKKVIDIKTVTGSAFSIGSGFFLTAGHVIKKTKKAEHMGCGFVKEGDDLWHSIQIKDFEINEKFDLAVFKADLEGIKAMKWDFSKLKLLDNIETSGYPYAIDPELNRIDTRAFKGYIVSSSATFPLLSKDSTIFYELSFQCPRGISGAPLFTSERPGKVKGIILGNKETPVTIWKEKTKSKDGANEKITEVQEAIHYGAAIEIQYLKDIEFKLLGGSLGDHLAKNNLIQE